MPTFYSEDVDIDPSEFLSACSSREKEELIDELIEDGYISKTCRVNVSYNYSVSESLFEEALQKLHGKWNMLTKEEEEAIIKIANRF
jgi:hypothetical protein